MSDDLYRRLRRFLRPLHPNRVWFHVRHGVHRLGWFRLRAFVSTWSPRRMAALARFLAAARAARRRRREEERLTVAVDVGAFWEPLTGVGWYLYRLLENLADRDDLRLRLYGPNLVDAADLEPPVVEPPTGEAIEVVRYTLPPELRLEPIVAWLRRRGERYVEDDRNDVVFAPNYLLPPSFRRARGRLVVTVHDVAFRRVPETMRESTRGELAAHLERTVARAVHILTDSETVLSELVESGLAEPGRVSAVHLGPGPVAAAGAVGAPPPGTPERYGLYVGTLEPRKNLPVLIDAWRRLRERAAGAPGLVLCGRYGWKSEELEKQVEAAAAEGWLVHFGYLEDARVAALYRGAEVVALPSLYEGFGLPAVEAMASGVPLVLSDIPVLREVGGDAALYAPPDDPEAWADAVGRLLGDPELRAELVRRGGERGRLFDWRRTAEATLAVWKAAAARIG